MSASLRILTTALLVLSVNGCGSSEPRPELYSVTGRVTLKGKPLESGKVVFVPTEVGGGKAYFAEIQGGEFRGETTAGEKNVQVISVRPTGEVIKGDHGKEYPIMESIIPKEYGEFSQLMFTVEPRPDNQLELELK